MNARTSDGEDGTRPAATLATPEYASRDQLRAMAHPLRLDIVERVGRRGTARAADVAADLGLPANSVSYHLRILARGGVIEEAPEAARDRRDRVWRLAQTSFHLDDPHDDDADYLRASGATSLAVLDSMRAAWSVELSRHRSRSSKREDGLGVMYNTTLRLSPEQMQELNDLINTTIQEYSRLNRDEHLADLPGDPDSDGAALTFRALWVNVGEAPPQQDTASQRSEDGSSSSSTASPS